MEGGNPYAKDKTLNYLKMESTIMEKIAKLEQQFNNRGQIDIPQGTSGLVNKSEIQKRVTAYKANKNMAQKIRALEKQVTEFHQALKQRSDNRTSHAYEDLVSLYKDGDS